ncbi:MAG: hypothetical protein HYY26_04215 [Acidobacteria bacterium]|nr:hypothetical protein [Acidobacteriota bacterium]
MEELERRLLALFDHLEQETADLHAFFELVGGNTPAEQQAVLEAVERLVARGWLEERGNDFYARTTAGRRALEPAS